MQSIGEPKKIDIDSVDIGGAVDKPTLEFDKSKYLGQKTTVASVDLFTSEFGPYFLIGSDEIGKEKNSDGQEVSIKAYLRLYVKKSPADNKYNWTRGGKTDIFMNGMGVSNPKELLGKSVKVNLVTTKKGTQLLSLIPFPK